MRDSIDQKSPFQTTDAPRRGGALAVGVVLVAFVGVAAWLKVVPAQPSTPNPYPKAAVHLPIHPLEDLNGQRRAELCALRQQQYAAVPSLAPSWPGYQAEYSKLVSQVDWAGGWVGIDGVARCTRDDFPRRFREGPSLLSAMWLNPYLPVLVFPAKFELGFPDTAPGALAPDVLPASAELDGPRRKLTVTYKLGSVLARSAREEQPPHVMLNHFNAREQGFTHYCVRAAEGLRYVPVGNANHPDGNVMPVDQDLRALEAGHIQANQLYIRTDSFVTYDLSKLPARLEIVLWKKEPEEAKTPADLTEVILLDGPAQEL